MLFRGMWIFIVLIVGALIYYYGFSPRAKDYGKQSEMTDNLNYFFQQAYINGAVERNLVASVKPNPYKIPGIESWAPVLILEVTNDNGFTIDEGETIIKSFLATEEFVRMLHVLKFRAVYCRGKNTNKGYYHVI